MNFDRLLFIKTCVSNPQKAIISLYYSGTLRIRGQIRFRFTCNFFWENCSFWDGYCARFCPRLQSASKDYGACFRSGSVTDVDDSARHFYVQESSCADPETIEPGRQFYHIYDALV